MVFVKAYHLGSVIEDAALTPSRFEVIGYGDNYVLMFECRSLKKRLGTRPWIADEPWQIPAELGCE